MHYVLLAINGLLMLTMPIILGLYLARHGKAGWALFGIGAATFIAAQLGHIPFNWIVDRAGFLPDPESGVSALLLVSIFLGLSAGIFEEGARYITFRWWAKDARNWWQGLMVGAGHGGIESILLGLVFVVSMSVLFGVESGRFTELVPDEALPLLQEQVAELLALPWYGKLLGALERLFAITVHLSMSLLVLVGVVRRQVRWLIAAVVWHALLDTTAVFVAARWGEYPAEMAIGVFAILSLALIFALRRQFPDRPDVITERQPPPPELIRSVDRQVTAERLDESRYH